MKVFVGGSGRSGTTILARVLGRHRSLHTAQRELRFITDPDGLISLRCALVDNWSFFQADIALSRFLKLMGDLGNGFWRYHASHLREITGSDFYSHCIDDYIEALQVRKFKSTWMAKRSLIDYYLLHLAKRTPLFSNYGKEAFYSSAIDGNNFDEITEVFVQSLFDQAAKLHEKQFLVEHTPSNLLHAEYLNSSLKHGKLIHV